MTVKGYFQYLPAIDSVLPALLNDLTNYLRPHRESLRKKYRLRDLSQIGFVHVRRGDYLTAPAGFSNLDYKTYYRNAINTLGKSRWLVLSDDMAWCKENLPSLEIIDEPDELVGLALMSLCHGGAIIANSTYSWWGAMLGPRQTTVVYPKVWLQNTVPLIFPNHWLPL